MVGVNLTILDQIAKFFILLSDAPAYWFALNTSCDHACHLSKRLGMDEYAYRALLVAGNLARYRGGALCIMEDEWKLFLLGHHLFLHLPPDTSAFQFDNKDNDNKV